MKILFITSNRLGDAILSTGILDAVGQAHGQSQITIVCGAIPAPLFKEWPGLKELIVLERKPLSMHWFLLWKKVVNQSWDMIVDIRGSAISYYLRTKERFVWRSRKSIKHKVEQLALMMAMKSVPYPCMHFNRDRLHSTNHLFGDQRPVIAVAPTANWIGKEWPHESFLELLKKVTRAQGILPYARIAIFSAPGERSRIEHFLTQIPKDQLIDCAGNLELLDVAAFFSRCDLFIGNDSGLMHLAAATGIPTLGLFGPSLDQHYAPYGKKTAYVRTPESYEILTNRQRCGEQGSLMTSLTVENVYKALEKFWKTGIN